MVRILGVDIPDRKRLEISLRYIYGIGPTLARNIISTLKLDPDRRAHTLTPDEVSQISTLLQDQYTIEGDLRREVQNNIKRLVGIHCYRGIRHKKGLPVRGQRTRTNARSRKGVRRTIAGKKRAPQQ
jgi:small subunit ribosomal protein S13